MSGRQQSRTDLVDRWMPVVPPVGLTMGLPVRLTMGLLVGLTMGLLVGLMSCSSGPPRAPLDRDAVLARSYSCNVLVALIDAAAASRLRCYGYDRPTTPNLDAIAAESVLFERAYAQATGTALSVYSFLSSRYPLFEKVPPLTGENAVFLSEDLITLPEAMATRFGHRLMVSTNPFVSAALGYDQGITDLVEDWQPDPHLARNAPPRYADRVNRVAIPWLRQHREQGFFAYLHYLEPHAPYLPPEPFRGRLLRRPVPPETGNMVFLRKLKQRRPPREVVEGLIDLYDGNLAFVDSKIGALVDSLRADGSWDQTIFVLLSDHGEAFWEHGTKGHGGVPYEELVHVPLLLRIPGIEELKGRRIRTPVELVDLMPTLLELSGIPLDRYHLAGRSWLPLLLGEESDDPEADERLLHMRSNRTNHPVYALGRGRFKWLYFVDRDRVELYDLASDPGEKVDLLKMETTPPEIAKRFRPWLAQWLQEGEAETGASTPVDPTQLDARMIDALRSLGYIE